MAQPYAVVTARIDAILAFDWLKHLPAVTTPTLIVCAADDILTPPYQSKRLAKAIAGSRLEVLATGGHSCSRVVPDEFNALVADFFATAAA
ncbi:alpha/beta fold hydrolase [Candidatus Burkholderia verschuerenii]|uniref:alpha/beta fold hydrolase n=1 Tax=Candidatus Burkholderia verschuerenii TaxID=242163 RepID=UPI00067B4642|nr:alpha/beta fold hydrolase [Candidatus Burkholderia verschuerenii]